MRLISLVFSIFFLISCSNSEDINTDNDDEFIFDDIDDADETNNSFVLTSNTVQLEIDEETQITLDSDLPLETIEISTDNFNSSVLFNQAGASSLTTCLSFRGLGNQTVNARATGIDSTVLESNLEFNISLGTPVKITGVRVNTFFNIDDSWDEEFDDNDPNRFADVLVILGKQDCSYQGGNANILYLTSIIENVSEELFWDLDEFNIYVGLDQEVQINVLDDDPGISNYQDGIFVSVIDDGTGNIPVFNVSDYLVEKPESIRFTDDQADGYDIEIYLEWIE